MQPIIKDEQGRARFLANRIVRFLLDEASEGRKCDPAQLPADDFSIRDWDQLDQLASDSGNKVVRFLLREASAGRKCDLNRLVRQPFPQRAWEQFFQLIGYSIVGYHELSFVSDEAALEASQAARKRFPDARGCRDSGCEIHCGVKREKDTAEVRKHG